jgi:hypothetical protein
MPSSKTHSRYGLLESAALFLVSVAVGLLAGCAVRTSRPPETGPPLGQPVTSDFVELRAGNRVVVVIPILRSGGYVVPSLRTQDMTGGGRIEAGPNFLGYEQDFYTVKHASNGVHVRFSHGVVWRNGKVQKVHAPRVILFEHMENSCVRLVFLERVSEADHDMAIVSSGDLPRLNEITRQVTARAECRSSIVGSCTWVPRGIAVRPE